MLMKANNDIKGLMMLIWVYMHLLKIYVVDLEIAFFKFIFEFIAMNT
jgi:hypothetical protein